MFKIFWLNLKGSKGKSNTFFLTLFFLLFRRNYILRRKTVGWRRKNGWFNFCLTSFQQCWIPEFYGFCHANILKLKNSPICILEIKYNLFCYNSAFIVQTHGTRKNDKLSVALSKKSRKSQNKIKWKQCNIYGNTRCILNIFLSEPLYFQRLQNCCTELLGNTLWNSCVLRK